MVATLARRDYAPVSNVKNYGASGDGVTDDTAEIQAAINTGGITFFPVGDYKVTSELVLPADATILGTGNLSRFVVASALTGVLTATGPSMDNIRITDVGISASGSGVGVPLVYFNDVIDSWLTRVYGAITLSACNTIRGQDCVADGDGFDLTNVYASHFVGMESYARPGNAAGFALNTVQDCTFHACLSVQSSGHGIGLAGSDRNTFTGCKVENPSYLSSNSYDCVNIDANSDDNVFIGGRYASHDSGAPATYEAHARYGFNIASGALRNKLIAAAVGQAATASINDAGTSTSRWLVEDGASTHYLPASATVTTTSGDLNINPSGNLATTKDFYANGSIKRNTASAFVIDQQTAHSIQIFTNDSPTTGIEIESDGDLKIKNNVGFYGTAPAAKPEITGAKGSNAALGSLLSALATLGLITDSSSA